MSQFTRRIAHRVAWCPFGSSVPVGRRPDGVGVTPLGGVGVTPSGVRGGGSDAGKLG